MNMDISSYELDDLLLAAIKSEVESREIYTNLARDIENDFLKGRLEFLAREESGHKKFLEKIYIKNNLGKKIVLPETTPVPLPDIDTDKKNIQPSEVLAQAMEAELATADFYDSLSKRFINNETVKKAMAYLGVMEMGHYKLLELEKEQMDRMEDYDEVWQMMHIGP